MNIVEQWGTGIQRVLQTCASAGVASAEITVSGNTVRMMIARPSLPGKRERQPRKRRPNKRDEALLAFLKAHPEASLREAADAFFVNVSTISRSVQDMRKAGRL